MEIENTRKWSANYGSKFHKLIAIVAPTLVTLDAPIEVLEV